MNDADQGSVPEPLVPRPRRPRWIVIGAALAVVVLIGAGFWFATQFQSTAQREADAKAPAAGPVFAEVAKGTLAGEVTFTGQVGPSTQTPITVPAVPNASVSVVTGRPLEAGAGVASGQVLTELNGRPLFGVQSAFSFYRDMGVGDRGPDVEALQRALASRSYPVAADGRFGAETAAAVTRWYRDNGYEAPTRAAPKPETPRPGESDKATESATPAPAPPTLGFVPVAELVAIPAASAQVIQGLAVGQHLAVEGKPDVILGSSDIVVTITAPASDLGKVVAGDRARISVNGVEVEGTVGDIRPTGGAAEGDAAAKGSEGSGSSESSGAQDAGAQDAGAQDAGAEAPGAHSAPEVTFVVIPDAALPVSAGRARVAVTEQIVAQDTLIVPVLAVADRGSGKNVITKQQDDGSLIEVPVTVLGTLQGEAAIAPVAADAVEVGDLVRVG